MMNKTDIQYKSIALLRFPLIICVVIEHIGIHIDISQGVEWGGTFTDEKAYIMLYCVMNKIFSSVAVPTFFFVSGFLFFNHVEKFDCAIYKNKIQRRIKTLLIPYILWNLIALLSDFVFYIGVDVNHGEMFSKALDMYLLEKGGWLAIWWTTPLNLPLWFIRDLMIMTILTPIIYVILKRCASVFLCMVFITYIFNLLIYVYGINISTIFYYCLGCYFSIQKINFYPVLYRLKRIAYALAPILLMAEVFYFNQGMSKMLVPVYSLVRFIILFNIAFYLINKNPKVQIVSKLNPAVMFVYGLHTISLFVYIIHQLPTIQTTNNYFCLSLVTVITPIIQLGLSLAIYYFVKRFLPMFVPLLNGNR